MVHSNLFGIGLDKGLGIETLSAGVIIRGGYPKISREGVNSAELSNGLQLECRFHESGGFEVVR